MRPDKLGQQPLGAHQALHATASGLAGQLAVIRGQDCIEHERIGQQRRVLLSEPPHQVGDSRQELQRNELIDESNPAASECLAQALLTLPIRDLT